MCTRGVFTAHTGQHVLPGTQAHKQSKWDQPNTDAKVGRDFCEAGLVAVSDPISISIRCPTPSISIDVRRIRERARVAKPPEPHPVIRQHQQARQDEQRVGQLHDWKVSQVCEIDGVAGDAEGSEVPGKGIDQGEEDLDDDDSVDEPAQDLGRKNTVFFNNFREVVQPAGYREGKEGEAQSEANIAKSWENVHF